MLPGKIIETAKNFLFYCFSYRISKATKILFGFLHPIWFDVLQKQQKIFLGV